MNNPLPGSPYGARKWSRYAILVALILVVGGIIVHPSSNGAASDSVPSLSAIPTSTPVIPSPTAGSAPETSSSRTTPAATIAGGTIEQLYIPAPQAEQTINTPVLPMPSGCQTVIEPPTSGPHVGDVFQCMDFAMPGTNAMTNTVVAGHSSYDLQTVFNKLYPQGESLVGRQVFVRTDASGSKWLAYQIQHVYQPNKSELPAMEELWHPTPGRLILITCMQEGDGVSTRNFIVVTQFVGIQNP